MVLDEEKKAMFRQIRTRLGAPIRPVEVDDNQMCDLLEMCVNDYAEKVYNWVIENQWVSLYGKDISSIDMGFALSVRTLDMMKDYSYWFSKEVGLQQRGPWELKKDFITIENGKQVYIIPSGREINKVMYMTPPTTNTALFASFAGLDIGFGGGFAQLGGGYAGGGPIGGYYIMPSYDISLLATDLAYKNKLLRSDLTYKVTAGPNGTRLLHLISTPGSKFSFGYVGLMEDMIGLVGCNVWYTYYDVNPGEEDECRLQNPDVLITPDQVPLDKMDFAYMNAPTKTIIRQLLLAKVAHTIGLIKGHFSGEVSIPMAEAKIDYQMYLQLGDKEEEKTMRALEERLARMNPYEVMKKQAELVQSMMDAKKGVPLEWYMI